MVEKPTQEWFLEVEGRKTGPFAMDQILGLLADGEIPPTARVMPANQDGQPGAEWITVEQLAQKQQAPKEASKAPAKPFIPPPRPADLQPATAASMAAQTPSAHAPASSEPVEEKPELTLIDALRANKERRAHQNHPEHPAQDETPTTSTELWPEAIRNIPRKAWLLAATAVLLIVASWGLTHFIKQKVGPTAGVPMTADTTEAPVRPTTGPTHDSVHPTSARLPAGQPGYTTPASAAVNDEVERIREQERLEREAREERERNIASENAASQAPPQEASPPPPLTPEAPPPQPETPATDPANAPAPPPADTLPPPAE